MNINVIGLMILVFNQNCELVWTDSVLPTHAQQVNLLTSVEELFEQVKYASKTEQETMNDSIKSDIQMTLKWSQFLIGSLRDLYLLKLTSNSNSVCSIDEKESMVQISQNAAKNLDNCTNQELGTINSNSRSFIEHY
ncbi:uncharacterized protein LOC115880965 [Sitophilus oryzae]|uniref:Uncharacterized protein LOC115880965 n=1 Tax=Sitophilus oryzae TaxID=7048 RepID=A0A6J2XT25_SITOR|nr:uncharacterized protein LOC115880965 [Sitophilus oryzae]